MVRLSKEPVSGVSTGQKIPWLVSVFCQVL